MDIQFDYTYDTGGFFTTNPQAKTLLDAAAQVFESRLTDNLKELHLPTFRDCFEEVAQQAQQDSFGYERYLLELAERECASRRHRRIERLLRASRLPLEKDLESLDLKRFPNKVVNQVKTLLEGSFLDRKENVLAFGLPGRGKSLEMFNSRWKVQIMGVD